MTIELKGINTNRLCEFLHVPLGDIGQTVARPHDLAVTPSRQQFISSHTLIRLQQPAYKELLHKHGANARLLDFKPLSYDDAFILTQRNLCGPLQET